MSENCTYHVDLGHRVDEDDGEDGGNDADQVDQVHLVREELALVRADQQPQEVPGTDFWKTNICIHIPLKTHSLDDKEGGGHVVDDVQHGRG